MSTLSDEVKTVAESRFEEWCQEHREANYNLPIKGRLYGALVVLSQIETGEWSFSELGDINSTDPSKFFGNRSISGHTRQRVASTLEEHGYTNLVPHASQGEMGRTSTGTKIAGLQFIQLIRDALNHAPDECDRNAEGAFLVEYLFERIVSKLLEYQQLGGIDVAFSASETITTYISRLLDAHQANSGAVLQHLIGAKLEIRYMGKSVIIHHNSSSTADSHLGRLGDFEIGSTVFHVTKSANDDHYRKAWQNAENGRKVYLLVPDRYLTGTRQFAEGYRSGFSKKVNIFPIEQFVAQNLDEIAVFDRDEALRQLRSMLIKYNELTTQYESDPSLRIIIPDFGVESNAHN